MKTQKPLILTARIAEEDREAFDRLRTAHFPPDRNFIKAHLTMFHRLPGEHAERLLGHLEEVSAGTEHFMADVSGLRHLGAGIAFSISSPPLEIMRATLKERFGTWLGPQDLQKWQPHITIQNKVSREKADRLYDQMKRDFAPHAIEILGLDLWNYLGGPWQHLSHAPFGRGTS